MDDLAGKISEILNDPASMEKIKILSNMLGIAPDSQDSSPTGQTAPAAPQNANPLEALLGSLSGNAPVYPENRPAVIQCSAGG